MTSRSDGVNTAPEKNFHASTAAAIIEGRHASLHRNKARSIWRVTCFVVDRKHRRRGVAAVALQGALQSIEKKGGGLVEAYPLINWDKLRRFELRRRGHAPSFGNMSTHGTISMFEKHGFKTVAPFGGSNVLMRRTV
jgi:GNAT superfamily N-acetyltransferase